VAQLAGLPKAVVHRAEEVLSELEKNGDVKVVPEVKPRSRQKAPREQLPLFEQKSPVADEILKLDISSMTPLEAITKLYELQRKAKEG
jgi:DNA mismatch repair protein MutS